MDQNKERVIEWECTRVLKKFCLFNDRKQSNALAKLFTPDGVWIRLGITLKGRRAIREAMDHRPATAIHLHILSNVLVSVIDPHHAESSSYKTIYYLKAEKKLGKPLPLYGPTWVSIYQDEFLRTEEGWRISKMRGTTLYDSGSSE